MQIQDIEGGVAQPKGIGGAVFTKAAPLTIIKYADTTYEYYCEAAPGIARSTADWQVTRKTISTGDLVYAGTGKSEHAATSLAVVTALTYTLGA